MKTRKSANKLKHLSALKDHSSCSKMTTVLSNVLSDNKIKVRYPKLFSSKHFYDYLPFYIVFLEYLDYEERYQNKKRNKVTLKTAFTYKDFHARFKSYLKCYCSHLVEEYVKNSTHTQKIIQKILQNFHHNCPILIYDMKKSAFKINSELRDSLYPDFCEIEHSID